MSLPRDAQSHRAVKAFERAGWEVDRIKGSHHILTKPGVEPILSVPCHKGKPLKPKLLSKLIKAAGLSVEQFIELYR